MSEQTTAVIPTPPKAPVGVGARGIEIKSLDELWRVANYIAASGLAPKGIDKPEAILIAVQMGMEVGLSPMASLQNIAVVNGRPTLWGDAQLAVVRGTGELEAFDEWFEVAGKRVPRNPQNFTDDVTAVCSVKRSGYPSKEFGFSVADAKRAGLWAKQGPWSQYPARMLKYRARAFVLRDEFGDALRGLKTAEEIHDEKPAVVTGPVETITVGEAAPQAPAPAQEQPQEKPAQVLSTSDQLAEKIVQAGFTFDDYERVCKFKKWLPTDADLQSFDDVSPTVAARHLRIVGDIIAAIKQDKGVE